MKGMTLFSGADRFRWEQRQFLSAGNELECRNFHDWGLAERFQPLGVKPLRVTKFSVLAFAGSDDCLNASVQIKRHGRNNSREAGDAIANFETE